MKHDLATQEAQETAALYALGALSQREAREFDLHLREGCSVCNEELAQFDQVVGLLGSAAAPASPSAFVRDLLTVRIEKEASRPRTVSKSVIPFPEKTGAFERRIAASNLSFSQIVPWAIAALVLIAFGYFFLTWRSDRQSMLSTLDQERMQRYKFSEDNSALKDQLAKETELSTELAQINGVLSSPQFRIISLNGLGPAPDGSAKVYWDIRGNRWVVRADLPPVPQGKVYQLWFVTSTSKVSAGLIKPDKAGHGFAVLNFPPNLGQVQKTAITLEPDGGSPQPTSDIYALGSIS